MLSRRGFGLYAQALKDTGPKMFVTMSLARMVKKGKQNIQKFIERYTKVKVDVKNQKGSFERCKSDQTTATKGEVGQRFTPFAQHVQKYAIRTLAGELRKRAAWRFKNGQIPTFAFVSFGLAMTQNQQKGEELSSEIREIFEAKDLSTPRPSLLSKVRKLSLDVFQFGKQIGQGCNAAVYEARVNEDDEVLDDTESDITVLDNEEVANDSQDDLDFVEDHFAEESEVSPVRCDDSLEDIVMVTSDEDDSDIEVIQEVITEIISDEQCEQSHASVTTEEQDCTSSTEIKGDYDMAVKMMFNYDIESNAERIVQVMMKEVVPARGVGLGEETEMWQNGNRVRLKHLPPHPNIVDMVGMFVGQVPGGLGGAVENFPHALPTRLNPEGFGRNMTMFIVMKKYDMTLREYLAQYDLSMHSRCLLLLQLLEGAVHLGHHQVVHRDLKSNNILISETGGEPQLVISDFGCCHADPEYGMTLPYFTPDTDKGGNQALMPPEISTAEPGYGVWLDYSRADLWAIGTLVYEIFGLENPFSGGTAWSNHFDSRTYREEDLPELPAAVPEPIRKLTASLLQRNPQKRPSAVMAANVLHLYFLFPDWFRLGNKPTVTMVTESLVLLAAEQILSNLVKKNNSMSITEMLKLLFLKRLDLNEALKALNWFHGN